MRIAEHCKPGMYANKEGWIPQQPWADDVYVQWGGSGVVFSKKKGAYTTAFFEAFPKKPKTFIRGEGKDIAEAELDAFKQYQRYLACPEHEFERRGYDNGAGICKHCELFKSKAFPPHKVCHCCGKAIWEGFDDIHGNLFCEECMEADKIPKEDWTESFRKFKKEEEEFNAFFAEKGIDVKEWNKKRKQKEAEEE